jgi:hypothetical protein
VSRPTRLHVVEALDDWLQARPSKPSIADIGTDGDVRPPVERRHLRDPAGGRAILARNLAPGPASVRSVRQGRADRTVAVDATARHPHAVSTGTPSMFDRSVIVMSRSSVGHFSPLVPARR